MSSSPNTFFIETAARQGWLSVEQIVAAQKALADNPALDVCDHFLQAGWLGTEHVEWLRQMETLRRSGQKLKSLASSSGGGAAVAAASFPPSAAADGRYAVGVMVAEGGMGAILQATDASINRTVAMKVMLEDSASRQDHVHRFINEAKITGQLEHPGIVPIYDLGTDAHGAVFYTMKFVRGINLQDVLDGIRAGNTALISRYPLGQLLTIFQKVCDAAAFAHSKNVVHRDLKPENIMIGEYGEVLVMDWGLAKVLGAHEEVSGEAVSAAVTTDGGFRTMAGSVMGTPYYMAPEQAEGRVDDIDARTDIYALGGILYTILTLEKPILGETLDELLQKISRGEILPPTLLNRPSAKPRDSQAGTQGPVQFPHCPGRVIPESLSAVAMKALSVSRRKRYQTVPELQKEIAAYQGGFATSAESAGMFKHLKLLIQRHQTESRLIAAGFVVVVGLTAYSFVKVKQSERVARVERDKAMENEKLAQAKEKEAKNNLDRALKGESLAAVKEGEAKKSAELAQQKADEAKKNAELAQQKADEAKRNAELALEKERLAKENLDRALKGENLAAVKTKEAKASQDKAIEIEKTAAKTAAKTMGIVAEEAAPAFYEQAVALARDGRFEDALEKVSYAIKLAPQQADYHALKGNLLESLLCFPEARDAYNEALRFNLTHAGAKENIALCEKIVRDNPALKGTTGRKPITSTSLRELQIAMQRQGRTEEAIALLKQLAQDSQLALETCRSLLEREGIWAHMQKQGGTLTAETNGTLSVNMTKLEMDRLPPLAGLPIGRIILNYSKVTELSALKGLPLTHLSLQGGLVADISALKGIPLEDLSLDSSKVGDLAPLKGMPLKALSIVSLPLNDINALEGMPLESLNMSSATVRAVSPLKGMRLRNLNLTGNPVTDLGPLQGMPLAALSLANTPVSDIRALEGMPLVSLDLTSTKIVDIAPLRNSPLGDLVLNFTRVTSIASLKGLPLTKLNLVNTRVKDLSPLKDMALVILDLTGTPVSDLSPLRGMPLKHLVLTDCREIKDLSPLSECKDLEKISVPPQCRKFDALRNLPHLKLIDTKWDSDEKMAKAEDFWKKVDSGKKGDATPGR